MDQYYQPNTNIFTIFLFDNFVIKQNITMRPLNSHDNLETNYVSHILYELEYNQYILFIYNYSKHQNRKVTPTTHYLIISPINHGSDSTKKKKNRKEINTISTQS